MKKSETIRIIEETGVIAIMRAQSSGQLIAAAEAIQKGVLTSREWENIVKSFISGETMTERMFKRLPLEVKQHIFDENKKGMTPHELEVYGAILQEAIDRGQ